MTDAAMRRWMAEYPWFEHYLAPQPCPGTTKIPCGHPVRDHERDGEDRRCPYPSCGCSFRESTLYGIIIGQVQEGKRDLVTSEVKPEFMEQVLQRECPLCHHLLRYHRETGPNLECRRGCKCRVRSRTAYGIAADLLNLA